MSMCYLDSALREYSSPRYLTIPAGTSCIQNHCMIAPGQSLDLALVFFFSFLPLFSVFFFSLLAALNLRESW